ncbi:hypothetical protein Tco_1098583 [Tanacetum coccineum]
MVGRILDQVQSFFYVGRDLYWTAKLVLWCLLFDISWFPGVAATDAAAAGDAFCCFQASYFTVCLNGWVMLLLMLMAGLHFAQLDDIFFSSVVVSKVKWFLLSSGGHWFAFIVLIQFVELGTTVEVSCQRCKLLVSETLLSDFSLKSGGFSGEAILFGCFLLTSSLCGAVIASSAWKNGKNIE